MDRRLTVFALVGKWRQIRPDPAPAEILITFEADGRLTYSAVMGSVQHIPLHWRTEGETLIVGDQVSRFRFASDSMLVLERQGERFVYVRTYV